MAFWNLSKDEYEKLISTLDPKLRNQFELFDAQMKFTKNKPIEFFIKQFQQKTNCYDYEMWFLNKVMHFAFLTGDKTQYHLVIAKLWNHLDKTHFSFIESQMYLKECENKIQDLEDKLRKHN